MVVVEETVRAAPQNNLKPETNSLLLGSGSRLPAAPASSNTTTTTVRCPECGSQRVWKDGLRYTGSAEIQRYLCRNCYYRFSHIEGSEPSERLQILHTLILKSKAPKPYYWSRLGDVSTPGKAALTSTTKPEPKIRREPCSQHEAVSEMEEESRTQETVAGATKKQPLDPQSIKGIITQYLAYLESEGYYKDHDYDHAYVRLIRLLAKRGANLLDPEDVKSAIAKQPWKNGVKRMAVYAYDALTKILKIQWTPPAYKQEEALPFIPEEKELDALILGSRSRRMTAFLQTLKETFADPGEALRLRWIDLDSTNNTITINHPVRGHNPRQLKVSSKLVALLNALPKTSEQIFPTRYVNIDACFRQLKRRVANNLQNPRILSISFTTFRHWGATMTYHYTRKILLVKELLGHKRIENTMKYTRLVKFRDDEFDVETATTIEEAKDLLKVGFDYIAQKDNIMLFRKPKRFANLGVANEG